MVSKVDQNVTYDADYAIPRAALWHFLAIV
jgi:hypothetical protein